MSVLRLIQSAVLVSGACAVAGAARAEPQVQSGLAAVDLFALADRAREAGRSGDAEAIYEALSHDPDPDLRAEARFRKGLMLAELGRDAEAATAFQQLLEEKPDSPRVRLELATVLARMGDEAGARRQLEQAQTAGLPPDVALVVDQFANALRSRKALGGFIEVALGADTNINRATDAKTLDTIIAPLTLSEDARAQAGLGAKLSGQAYARTQLRPGLAILGRLSGQGEFYGRSQFDDMSVSAFVGPELTLPRDRLRPAVGASFRFYGNSIYARTQSATINWLHSIGTQAQLDSTVTISRADYAINDLQDGWIYDAAGTYERTLGPRAGLSASLSAARQSARSRGYSTTSGGANVLLWRNLGHLTVFGSVGARRLEADARLFLFPVPRKEWFHRAMAGATFGKAIFAGFTPVSRIIFERNSSTVGIYDYHRLGLELGLARTF